MPQAQSNENGSGRRAMARGKLSTKQLKATYVKKAQRAEEARWAARSGPVTTRTVTLEPKTKHAQPFVAKYASRCSVCRKTITPGQGVRYVNERLAHGRCG